jgi:hypothetical protein
LDIEYGLQRGPNAPKHGSIRTEPAGQAASAPYLGGIEDTEQRKCDVTTSRHSPP